MKMRYNIVMIAGSILILAVSGCATSNVRILKNTDGTSSLIDQSGRVDGKVPKLLPNIGENSTLQDYLKYAALNNPGLEAAFNRWKASMEMITQARSLPDPQLSYGYFIEEVETRVGPQRQKIELSQRFPWFGTLRLRKDIAARNADSEFARYQVAKLGLFYSVKKFFYEYYYLAKAIEITKNNMKLLGDLEEVASRKYTAGVVDHAVLIKAQVELGRLEDKLNTLKEFRRPVVAKLNAAMNREITESLPWPKAVQMNNSELKESTLLKLLRKDNPELQALASNIEKQKNAVALARKDYFPDFMLGIGWIDTGEALNPDLEGSGDDPLVGMIGLSIPLWFNKYRAAENEAKALYQVAKKQREDRVNTLSADISMVLFKYQDATRKLDLYGKSLLPKARQSLEVSKQAFESGKLDFLTLIDAERLLLEFELSCERALADQLQSVAKIELLTGTQHQQEGRQDR